LAVPSRTKADEPVNKRLPSSVIKWKKIAAIKSNKTCEDQMLINLFLFSVFLFFFFCFYFSNFPKIYFSSLSLTITKRKDSKEKVSGWVCHVDKYPSKSKIPLLTTAAKEKK
jgi:hypothetical protein